MSKTNQLTATFAGGRVLCLVLVSALVIGITPAVSILTQTFSTAHAFATEQPINLGFESLAFEEPSYAAESDLIEGDFTYTVDSEGDATITRYTGPGGDVIIPSELGGYPVTNLGTRIFKDNLSIDSVTIPEGFHSAGPYYFAYSSVKTVNLPSTWSSFEWGFFQNSSNMFDGCSQLAAINVPEANQCYCTIDGNLYNKDQNELVFYTGGKLDESFTIPESVTHICDRAFVNAFHLKTINLPNNQSSFSMDENGVLYNADKTHLYFYPSEVTSNSFAIPDTVTSVSTGAFATATTLEELTVPDSIRYVDGSNLSGPSIETINFGANSNFLERISDWSFGSNLKNVNVDEDNPNYSSDDGVLYNKDKTRLEFYPGGRTRDSFTIAESVLEVGSRAFADTVYLKTLNILAPLKYVSGFAFAGPSIRTINVGEKVSSIGSGFGKGLEEINVDVANSYLASENGVLYNRDKTMLLAYPAKKPGQVFVAPESVIGIGSNAFNHGFQIPDAFDDSGMTHLNAPSGNCEGGLSELIFPSLICDIEQGGISGFCCPGSANHETLRIVFRKGVDYTYYDPSCFLGYYNAVIVGPDMDATSNPPWSSSQSMQKTFGEKYLNSDLSDIELTFSDQEYTGLPIEPAIEFTGNASILREGKDYEVTYENNINPGHAKVTVVGIGEFKNSISATFRILDENGECPDEDNSGDNPVDPVGPMDPIDPVDPINPVEPITPTDPIDPVEPIDPEEPTDPVDPSDPVDPVIPADPIDPEPEPTPDPEPDPEPTPAPEPSSTWVKDSTGWWLKNEDGTYPASQWVQKDNTWYHFDNSGYMQTGWLKQGSTWYYLKDSGAMATGWQKVDGQWYYLNKADEGKEGSMATGWKEIDGTWYYLKVYGAMQTGWLKQGNTWYYLKDSGAMATGWQKVNGSWYHLDDKGHMQTGWQEIDNKWYYLNASGAMQTNCWVGNYWVGESGAMATNTTVDNGRYQVDENGRWVK